MTLHQLVKKSPVEPTPFDQRKGLEENKCECTDTIEQKKRQHKYRIRIASDLLLASLGWCSFVLLQLLAPKTAQTKINRYEREAARV